jgi:hypothetical protein
MILVMLTLNSGCALFYGTSEMTEADVTNEFCATYSRVTLAPQDAIMTKRLVFKNELKYECQCLKATERSELSKGLCQ